MKLGQVALFFISTKGKLFLFYLTISRKIRSNFDFNLIKKSGQLLKHNNIIKNQLDDTRNTKKLKYN